VDGLVYVQGEARLGAMVSVAVTDADVYDLYGHVADAKTQLRGALNRVSANSL
jgi:ribosomal protein S12 methylthiotransferase